MKDAYNRLYKYLLLLAVAASLMCCKPKAGQQKNQKEIDKQVLLTLVDSLAHTLALKGSTVADGRKLLDRYRHNYKIVVNGNPMPLPNTDTVFVNISNQSYLLFAFRLPKALQQQLSFKEMEKIFGPGILSPLPKEPVNFSTMFTRYEPGKVFIDVTSAALPAAKQNSILEITVSRLHP